MSIPATKMGVMVAALARRRARHEPLLAASGFSACARMVHVRVAGPLLRPVFGSDKTARDVGLDIATDGDEGHGDSRKKGRSPKAPPRWPLIEGGHLGCGGATDNLRNAIVVADIRLPFLADRVRIGGDSALGGGERGARLETTGGGIFALALGAIVEPDRAGTVFVTVVVEQRIAEALGLGNGVAIDVPGANGGADESADDALQEDLQAPFAEIVFHQLGEVDDGRFGSVANAGGICRVERKRARDARHLVFRRTELSGELKRPR